MIMYPKIVKTNFANASWAKYVTAAKLHNSQNGTSLTIPTSNVTF